MINPEIFFKCLKEHKITFFTGVPDSLLKYFNAYVMDHAGENHVIAANEGNAIALAAGHYLATGKQALVYIQNSGQGNTVNPLMSLADKEVYSIPMLLLVGWRGQPGVKDEPQHVKQGRVMMSLFESMEIPYEILPETTEEAEQAISRAVKHMNKHETPYALIAKKGAFEEYNLKNSQQHSFGITREQAVKAIIDGLSKENIIVSTTGKTSRELFEYREELKQGHEKDFLTVGSMGHASQIALGIALAKPDREIFCIDGDGAAIMHMGGIAIIGSRKPENFKHIIINNGAHDSVGGQPTVGLDIDFQKIAASCGYLERISAETEDEIRSGMEKLKSSKGPSLLEIKVNKGARKDLGRPTRTPKENKKDFMRFLSK